RDCRGQKEPVGPACASAGTRRPRRRLAGGAFRAGRQAGAGRRCRSGRVGAGARGPPPRRRAHGRQPPRPDGAWGASPRSRAGRGRSPEQDRRVPGLVGRARMTAILVTRPQAERDPVVGLLQERGYRVHAVPTVATVPIKIGLPDLERYDWIVVTSATGVLAL